MAGYDALSRGVPGEGQSQSAPPDQYPPPTDQQAPTSGQTGPYGDVWAEEQTDSWSHDQEDFWGEEDPTDDGGDGDDFF